MRRILLLFFCLLATTAPLRALADEPGAGTSGAKSPREKRRLVLCNDGGSLGAPDQEAPLGAEGLARATFDPLRDTMVDTLYWQIGVDPWWGTATHRLSDWYAHRTKVGAVWGTGRDKFKTAGEWRIYETTRQLMEQSTDSAAVVIEHGHRAGIDVFLSLRFNDGHDSRLPDGLNDVNIAPLKRQHPEWLLDPLNRYDPESVRVGNAFTRFGYNFAVPEVRQYQLALIREAIANYDLDGFDLDFCRQPTVFKPGEEERGMPLITEIVRQTRAALEEKGRASGRKLFLSVRVPPSVDYNRQHGLDVPTWIRERLVDIVVVGEPGGWNYRLPIEPYRDLAQGTTCKILAQNLCAFKEDRGRSAAVLFGERDYYSTEQFRAVAARHWQAGADGIYIWNQHWIKFYRDDRFDRQSWKEIGDPGVLARKDKHYLVGPKWRGGSLPIELAKADKTAEIDVEIADDLAAARRDGVLQTATLRLLVEQLTPLDQLGLELNGRQLDLATARKRLNYNDCWLDLDVASTMTKGGNTLRVTVDGRNPHVLAPLVVRSVEALIVYKPK